MDEPTQSPSQPHDKLFKALTDDPAVAGALIRERLPAEIVALLSDDPPEAVEGSFIDPDLRASQSDRLFKVRTRGGDEAYLFVLVEHKSTADAGLPLQLLGYMVRIWNRHVKDSRANPRALPAILPLVVYHGAETWTVPLSFRKMIAADEAVRAQHLDYSYALADLGKIDDDRLSGQAVLRAGLLALKYAVRESDPRPVLALILKLLPDDDVLILTMLTYILATFERVDRPMLLEALRAAKPRGEQIMVSLAAREWIEEGKVKGRAEGLQEGLNKGLREGLQEGLNKGLQEGLNKGLQEGLSKGLQAGLRDGRATTLLRLLSRRFGLVPDEVRARVEGATLETLDHWIDRVLEVPTLAALFEAEGA